MAKALQHTKLEPNTNYEVIITLDDGKGKLDKESRRFTMTTPKYIPLLSNYHTESFVSKSLQKDTKTTPGVAGYSYSLAKTYTFTLSNITVDIGTPTNKRSDATEGRLTHRNLNGKVQDYDPTSTDKTHQCKIQATFTGTVDFNKAQVKATGVKNISDPIAFILSNIKNSDIDVNNRTITIYKKWIDIDPAIDSFDKWTLKGDDWGFWNSPAFKILYDFDKTVGGAKKSKYWNYVSNAYIQYTTDDTKTVAKVDGTTTVTWALDSVLSSSIPAGILANTIKDYEHGVVDYFYFFVNQKGSDTWWLFDNDITTITQATKKSLIKGNKGSFKIVNGKLDPDPYCVFPKVIVDGAVTNKVTQLSKTDLKNRPISATAKVYSASATSKDDTLTNNTFPDVPLNITFAIVRYTKDASGNWKGVFMPRVDAKNMASNILSATEVIGAT